jgi:hypothetical protein
LTFDSEILKVLKFSNRCISKFLICAVSSTSNFIPRWCIFLGQTREKSNHVIAKGFILVLLYTLSFDSRHKTYRYPCCLHCHIHIHEVFQLLMSRLSWILYLSSLSSQQSTVPLKKCKLMRVTYHIYIHHIPWAL